MFCHRIGRQADDNYLVFADGRYYWRDDWEKQQRGSEQPDAAEKKEFLKNDWETWLKPHLKVQPPADMEQEERTRFVKQLELDRHRFGGTNLGESIQAVIQHEGNSLVQAVILFSEGRNTEGSAQTQKDLRDRLAQARIPVIVVALGEDRPQVRIEITDLRVPPQTRPDDPFRVTAEIIGEGLAEQDVKVYLDITHLKGDDLIVNNVKGDKAEPISLGKKITFEAPAKFNKGEGRCRLASRWNFPSMPPGSWRRPARRSSLA